MDAKIDKLHKQGKIIELVVEALFIRSQMLTDPDEKEQCIKKMIRYGDMYTQVMAQAVEVLQGKK